jgi:hypothetical protein
MAASTSGKGSPGTPPERTLRREWTEQSPEDERATLELELHAARAAADAREIRRLEARLRLLDPP